MVKIGDYIIYSVDGFVLTGTVLEDRICCVNVADPTSPVMVGSNIALGGQNTTVALLSPTDESLAGNNYIVRA